MDTKERAKQFFLLGEKYTEAAKLLLETLIGNGNSNAGIGKTIEQACQASERNAIKSDLYLFVPAIFNCLQSTELLIKGLLLLSDKEFEWRHGVEVLLDELKDSYNEDSEVYQKLNCFYKSQISIIEKFKQSNSINTSYDLYMSLRYPEITLQPKKGEKKGKEITVDYAELLCNGQVGIEQFKMLLESLEAVKLATVKEYHTRTP